MTSLSHVAKRQWIEYYLAIEIAVPLDNVAGSSVYFGAKNLMAYAQLCLIAAEMERCADLSNSYFLFLRDFALACTHGIFESS